MYVCMYVCMYVRMYARTHVGVLLKEKLIRDSCADSGMCSAAEYTRCEWAADLQPETPTPHPSPSHISSVILGPVALAFNPEGSVKALN